MQLPANASSDSSDLSLPQSSDAVDSITKTESEPPVYSEETPGAFEWKFENQKWYCYSQGAKLKGCGWVEMADGRLYYLLETDECAAGLYEVDGKWYYFNNAMQKNWQQIEGKWYYFDEETGEQVHGPGWVDMSDGRRYYLLETDECAVGWYRVDGTWYYFGNSVQKQYGWQLIEGKWYYFDGETGEQVHGPRWVDTSDGRKYYLLETDECATGLYKVEGAWYYFKNSVQKGWFTDSDGNQRYSNPTTGELNAAPGWYVIDGRNCYLLQYGIYVAPPTINSVLYTVSGQTATVTITATASASSTLHDTAYSWDGGKTWTNEASKAFSVGTTIAAGTIQVRDAVGNVTTYGSDLKLTGNGPYMGIDVSAYQGIVDWAAVKASGVDFAIIRALTWSNSVNYYVIDPYFEYNVRNAKANGIDVGVYLFSYAFNIEEIKEEIDFFHNSSEMQRLRADGVKFDYPVYIDFEWNTILEKTTYSQRTEMLRTGMIILEKYGYFPGFYSSMNWALYQYDARGLYNEGYHFWCARYPANPDISAGTGSWLGFEAQMWQYASDGHVNGVNGNVDMNICYVDYSSLIAGSESGGGSAELTLSVYDTNSGKQVTGSVESILAQVVMNEVGSWGNPEVCKAQAVAAYSWILYQQQHGNVIPNVGLATPTQTVKNAVKEVVGQALYYNGSVANAAYGSASAAYTNTAQAMWGLDLPYLNTPVSSPETTYRGKTTTVQLSTMQNNITKIVGASLANSTPHSQWITDPVFNSNGYLTSIKVCGRTVSAGTFYENCWGLYSPNFTMSYNAAADTWTFVTNGNGHCVGMSQYGAYWYAVNQGWNYQQILLHYFPGTIIR